MATVQLLSHTRIDCFKRCRKRAFWKYEVGIRRETDAKALRMGSAYHVGLDFLKQGKGLEAAVEAVRDQYATPPPGETDAQAVEWDFECETVVALVSGYEWRWREWPLAVVASEQVFRLPLRNPATGVSSRNWKLAGKIDGIVALEDGRLAVLEHKLQSDPVEPESDFWARLKLDHQITLYIYAARSLGYDVATVLYDVARKPTIRPERVPLVDEDGKKIVLDKDGNRVMTQDGKSPRQTADASQGWVLQSRPMTCEEWVSKLLADVIERPNWYYARQEIPRLDQDIDDFLAELWEIQQVMRDAQRNDRWYRTVSRDTCSFCPYFWLCATQFNPQTGLVPDGFKYITNKHPELGEEEA